MVLLKMHSFCKDVAYPSKIVKRVKKQLLRTYRRELP
jgi:hypothetical protein